MVVSDGQGHLGSCPLGVMEQVLTSSHRFARMFKARKAIRASTHDAHCASLSEVEEKANVTKAFEGRA